MIGYQVTDVLVTLPIGLIVKLTDRQADKRRHCLRKRNDGLFTIEARVQLKRGELFYTKKPLSRDLVPLDKLTCIPEKDADAALSKDNIGYAKEKLKKEDRKKPKAEAPKTEAPKTEAPKTEAPKGKGLKK